MRTKLLYIALALGVACSAQKLHNSTVNTIQVYIMETIETNEDNDCSVRALSVAMDIVYREAQRQTRRYGRGHRQGMVASRLIDLVQDLHGDRYIGVQHLDKMTARSFVDKYADTSESYIMISKDHVSVLKYKPSTNKWYMYGNPKDTTRKYIAVIKLTHND